MQWLVIMVHREIAFANVDVLRKSLKVLHHSLSAFIPRDDVVNLKNYGWVGSR